MSFEYACAGVYLDIPELAVMGFLVLPVRKGIIAGVKERFFCLAFFGASAMAHALCLFQDASPSF